MSTYKLVVFGAHGMLGRYVTSYFSQPTLDFDVVPITRQQYDVLTDSTEKLDMLLEELQTSHDNVIVVNAIGMIPQKHKNAQTAQYIKINSVFPHILSELCLKHDINMIHATTDCVFSGEKGNYTEIDHKDDKQIYGISKGMGEPERCCVIRTSIIGEELNTKTSPSFLEFVRENRNDSINGFENHRWNGVTCLQFAKIVRHIIEHGIMWDGTRHIFTPKSVSKYELALLINDIYDLNVDIAMYHTLVSVDKTLSTVHETNDLLKIPDIATQIAEMKLFVLS
jgi:dTDP-4-dehydrorhamnose reductase